MVEEARVKQRPKRLGEASYFDPLVDDEEALEERLVPESADLRARPLVGGVGSSGEVERFVEDRLDFPVGGFGVRKMLLGLCDLPGEGVLLLLQQVDRHGLGEVGIKQRLALGLQPSESGTLEAGFTLAFGGHASERLGQSFADRLDVARPRRDAEVVRGGEVDR